MSEITPYGTHAVIYTDGGCDNPRVAGWGIHGYVYNDEVAKQGTGNGKALPTKFGYKMGESGKPDITLTHYIDGFGTVTSDATNNVAELEAALSAVKFVSENKIQNALFMMDSKYVLDGFDKWMYNWQKNNWVKSDGQPVGNSAHWKELYDLKTQLTSNGYTLNTKWVKGHSGDLGNDRADMLATSGKLAARNGYVLSDITVRDAKGYWAPKSERNRMLNYPNWFFMADQNCPQPTPCGRHVYHIGTIRDKIELAGKTIAAASFAIIFTKERDPVLDKLVTAVEKLKTERPQGMMIGYLDTVFKPAIYDQISDFGTSTLIHDRRGRRLSTKVARSVNGETRSEDVPVLHEADPPGLCFRLLNTLNILEDRLHEHLGNTQFTKSDMRKTDLTDILYECEKSAKKETTKLKKTITQGMTHLKVPVNYYDETAKADKTVTITLTLAQDLPDRNTLSAIASEGIKATVLTWPESSRAIRFAVVIESNGDVGLWVGPYANLQMIPIK